MFQTYHLNNSLLNSFVPASKDLLNNFSISSHSLFNKNAAQLYTTKDINEMFTKIPKLMSCQRGIQVSYQQLDISSNDYVLKQTSVLNNGKTLYFYLEKGCPELSETVLLLANIQSY